MAKRKQKLLPCPKCNSSQLRIYDCNYSSFNCGDVKCLDCGFQVNAECIGVSDSAENDLIRRWNGSVTDFLKKQQEDNDRARIKECILTLKKKFKFPLRQDYEGGGPGYDDFGEWVWKDGKGKKIEVSDIIDLLMNLEVIEKLIK